jgi:hypothetical protein
MVKEGTRWRLPWSEGDRVLDAKSECPPQINDLIKFTSSGVWLLAPESEVNQTRIFALFGTVAEVRRRPRVAQDGKETLYETRIPVLYLKRPEDDSEGFWEARVLRPLQGAVFPDQDVQALILDRMEAGTQVCFWVGPEPRIHHQEPDVFHLVHTLRVLFRSRGERLRDRQIE